MNDDQLKQACMLLREALISLREICINQTSWTPPRTAPRIDPPEWNEGGSYYNLMNDIKDFLKETGK